MAPLENSGHSDEELMRQALADPSHFGDWEQLRSRFSRELPVDRLRMLLLHNEREAVLGGLYIAEELGDLTHPVLEDLVALLQHRDAEIRSSAFVAISSCARRGQERAFAFVLRGLQDSDPTCRVTVMWLLAQASSAQLVAATESVEDLDPTLQQGLRWLLSEPSQHGSGIDMWLHSDNAVLRRFAAIMAVRDPSHLRVLEQLAASGGEPDTCEFAEKYIEYTTDLAKQKDRYAKLKQRRRTH